MKQRYRAVYDGEVLRLKEPATLETNREYTILIEDGTTDDTPGPEGGAPDTFAFVLEHAEDLDAEDLAEQHDYYLYGTPKR